MKTCSYCRRENDDARASCHECGTAFDSAARETKSPEASRRARIILTWIAAAASGIVLLTAPGLVLMVPVLVIFYLPVFLPFLLSFRIESSAWKGLQWSLRAASAGTLFVSLIAMSVRADYGDDVAGNLAGAAYNFRWTWGVGTIIFFIGLFVGWVLHEKSTARTSI